MNSFEGAVCRLTGYLQFEQRQRGICVKKLLLALLIDVFLKCGRRLRVIAVQAVEDLVNVRRPLLAFVEGIAHFAPYHADQRCAYQLGLLSRLLSQIETLWVVMERAQEYVT